MHLFKQRGYYFIFFILLKQAASLGWEPPCTYHQVPMHCKALDTFRSFYRHSVRLHKNQGLIRVLLPPAQNIVIHIIEPVSLPCNAVDNRGFQAFLQLHAHMYIAQRIFRPDVMLRKINTYSGNRFSPLKEIADSVNIASYIFIIFPPGIGVAYM